MSFDERKNRAAKEIKKIEEKLKELKEMKHEDKTKELEEIKQIWHYIYEHAEEKLKQLLNKN